MNVRREQCPGAYRPDGGPASRSSGPLARGQRNPPSAPWLRKSFPAECTQCPRVWVELLLSGLSHGAVQRKLSVWTVLLCVVEFLSSHAHVHLSKPLCPVSDDMVSFSQAQQHLQPCRLMARQDDALEATAFPSVFSHRLQVRGFFDSSTLSKITLGPWGTSWRDGSPEQKKNTLTDIDCSWSGQRLRGTCGRSGDSKERHGEVPAAKHVCGVTDISVYSSQRVSGSRTATACQLESARAPSLVLRGDPSLSDPVWRNKDINRLFRHLRLLFRAPQRAEGNRR